jgi:hypothetical protein
VVVAMLVNLELLMPHTMEEQIVEEEVAVLIIQTHIEAVAAAPALL